MEKLRFIKDHPNAGFKKGQIVNMPKENVKAWIDSGYCALGSEPKKKKEVAKKKKNSED
jgi:hypothetical protein